MSNVDASSGSTATGAVTSTEFTTSSDGTRIAFQREGTGPVLVLVDGALCYRAFGPSQPFAAQLRDAYTVVSYDRRGRVESGDASVYRDQLEIDDLRAVIAAATAGAEGRGAGAFVLGFSSGAALAYRAAAAGVPMRKLVGYEAPYVGRRPGKGGATLDYLADLDGFISRGENGKAVDYFMVRMVGGPVFLPIVFRLMRGPWAKLRATAPTLRYEARVMGGTFDPPVDELSHIAVPTLVVWGGKAAPEMVAGNQAIAAAVPGAETRVLDGQTHNVAPTALAPVLRSYLA